MSTKPSMMGRSASTQGNSVVTNENDCPEVKPKPAVKSKKDRSGLCAFTFADGRQCCTPRRSGHLHLCYFHGQKEAQAQAAKQAGQAISSFFLGNYLSAVDLSAALGQVFSAVAQGHIKPKAATALAYLGQTLNQTVKIASDEYANVYGGDVWRRKVASVLEPPPPPPQPAPRPRTPLPRTSAEFAEQLLAGLPKSLRSDPVGPTGSLPATPHVQPVPPNPQPAETPANCHSDAVAQAFRPEEPAFSSSSASASAYASPQAPATKPAPPPPPQPPTHCHSDAVAQAFRPEEPASSSNSSLATNHSPLPHVPPGFGAPANWDALIPAKPRRRFSRHWQFRD